METAPSAGSVLPAGGSISSGNFTSSLRLPDHLANLLKPHQVDGVHFLWKRLVDDGLFTDAARCRGASRLDDRLAAYAHVAGAVLGHSMGLGKTFTALCFAMMLQQEVYRRVHAAKRTVVEPVVPPFASCTRLRVLIIAPRSCIPHWEQNISEWVRDDLFHQSMPLYIPSLGARESIAVSLERFFRVGGFLVLGYEEHRKILDRLDTGLDHFARAVLAPRVADAAHHHVTSLLDCIRPPPPGIVSRWKARCTSYSDILRHADIVLLDESHRLKRSKAIHVTDITKNIMSIPLRVALTGTPLQNHLGEYLCMANVVTNHNIDPAQFRQTMVVPIERGQCVDATKEDFEKMQRCVARLRVMFATTVHRCGVEVLERSLPPRFETILFVELSSQQELCYLRMLQRRGESAKVLEMRHEASRICAHPILVDERFYSSQQDDSNDDDDEDGDGAEDEPSRLAAQRLPTVSRPAKRNRSSCGYILPGALLAAVKISDSPKLRLCMELVRSILQRGEKVVVFSMYIGILQLVGHFLTERRIDYFLLTGDTSLERRKSIMQEFRRGGPGAPSVFVCSTKAGGVGINLLPANHCILLDTSWNPADDCQATFRVFRYGQTRPVYTYRLCCYGTAEHVVFSYAVRKEWTHRKVCDLGDPHRREREERAHYLQYPCSVPLPGWILNDNVPGSTLTNANRTGGLAPNHRRTHSSRIMVKDASQSSSSSSFSDSSDSSDSGRMTSEFPKHRSQHRAAVQSSIRKENAARRVSAVERREQPLVQRVDFRTFLERCCPIVVTLHPDVVSTIVAAVEHSFLLRDNTDEIIQDLHRRLSEKAEHSRLLLSRATHNVTADDHENDGIGVRVLGSTHRVSSTTEHPVEDKVARIADTLVQALWQRHQQLPLRTDMDRSTWEQHVANAWSGIVCPPTQGAEGDNRFGAVQSLLIVGYRRACAEYVKKLRHSTIRANLDAHCHTALRCNLVDALTSKGATVWELLPPALVCESLTEQGFKRPFVPQMMHMGLRTLLLSALQRAKSDDGAGSVSTAVELIVPAHCVISNDDNDVAHPLLRAGLSEHLQLRIIDGFLDPVVDSVWPEYQGIPPAPQVTEERLQRGWQPIALMMQPGQNWGELGMVSVFSMAQVAAMAGLPQSVHEGGRRGHYLCKQCSKGIVRIRAPAEHHGPSTAVGSASRVCCDTCNFDAMDALLQRPALRSELLLERWSAALLSLADFDIKASLGAHFAVDELTHKNSQAFLHELLKTPRFAKGLFRRTDANCSLFSSERRQGASDSSPRQILRAGACHALPRILYALGIEVALSQIPRHHIMMLALQCGVSSVEDLQRRLVRYGTGVYEHVKPTCRSTLHECWSQLRNDSEFNDQRVPEMFVLLSLHYTATHEIKLTSDLLDDALFGKEECHDDEDAVHVVLGDAARCARLVAFREAAYAVAWSSYRGRLADNPLPQNLRAVLEKQEKALRHVSQRARSISPPSPQFRPQEIMPWSDDPARNALQARFERGEEKLAMLNENDSDSFISETSVPTPPSELSDDEGRPHFSSVVDTWTGRQFDTGVQHLWSDDDIESIRRYRCGLLWRSLVEVFGQRILHTPVWLTTRNEDDAELLPEDVLGVHVPPRSADETDDRFSAELLLPDDDIPQLLADIAPMKPAHVADAFFRMMLLAASSVSWVG